MAKPICFRLLAHFIRLAASRTRWTAGRSRPIKTAMIEITTSSSIRVNPPRPDRRVTALMICSQVRAEWWTDPENRLRPADFARAGRTILYQFGRHGEPERPGPSPGGARQLQPKSAG